MEIPYKYKRLESCSKEDLINKIIVREKHCDDLKELLDKWLKKYKGLEEENRKLKGENWVMKIQVIEAREDRDKLTEENKKLKEELGKFIMNK